MPTYVVAAAGMGGCARVRRLRTAATVQVCSLVQMHFHFHFPHFAKLAIALTSADGNDSEAEGGEERTRRKGERTSF